VSLTTYRKSGVGVATPVWIAPTAGGLVVTTAAGSGKVKRLRRDPRVELRPCSRRGQVADDAPTATGRAEILRDPHEIATAATALAKKYGWQHRLIMLFERVARRGSPERVILRITP
ncbi:MAG: PPOX class F420-dependent oxidoreductase, partial [Micrococcales bacterium]|nr:PPOX class F420-dependent oxidoreductase [Micrococcales bacterium]